MIHECLLNLWRCPLTQHSNKDWIHVFELNEFLHPGEQKLLEIIVDVAMDYHKINGFNRAVLNQSSADCKGPKGLYITAFCNGVHKVLEGYRKDIIKLEGLFLQNPQLSLTFILSSVEKYRHLFQTLLSMIQVIQEDNVHGCLLIGRLHKYGSCEVGQITIAAELIIKTINQIFHRHVCNWIIYGDLIDTYQEFFIVDEKIPDENFLYPEQLMELKESTQENSTHFVQLKRSKVRRPPHVRKFSINWQMVPLFINKDTAESILFMGQIIWIIRNGPKKSTNDYYQIKFRRDMEGKDNEYYNILQDLQVHTLNNIEFQRIMDRCRNKITEYLWTVMLDEGNLLEHLDLIRDYFVLRRGELFQQFIVVTETHLEETSNLHIQNLNFIFLETARKIYGENDKTYLKFELTSNSDITQSNPWAGLQLNFEIKWPLHIVFHPTVMGLYNKLFCFLLHLKKTQIDLHKLWVNQVSRKQKIDQRVWSLRQTLMFLVNNLQYYLQVDVIEAQFSLLLKAIQNANEFEDIIKLHNDFLSDLLVKTFLVASDEGSTSINKHNLYQIPPLQTETPSKVYNIIIKLLELCDKFCAATSSWGAILTEPQINELAAFKTHSGSIIETFLFILHRLHEKINGQHLLQLLLQLDFNRFFSKSKPDLNFSVLT